MLKLTVLTPTRNRPVLFNWLTEYLEPQKMYIHEWLVCTDNPQAEAMGYKFLPWQKVFYRKSVHGEKHSLCMNLLQLVPHITGDAIMIAEDDDYYHGDPEYPAYGYCNQLVSHLEQKELVGFAPALYYNLFFRKWQDMKNTTHASLSQTGFRRSVLPLFEEGCRRGNPYIDLHLWRRWPRKKSMILQNYGMHYGIKLGEGVGVGHKDRGEPDPQFHKLHSWLGPWAGRYQELAELLTSAS